MKQRVQLFFQRLFLRMGRYGALIPLTLTLLFVPAWADTGENPGGNSNGEDRKSVV